MNDLASLRTAHPLTRALASITLGLLLSVSTLFAVEQTGDITGTVRDDKGGALPARPSLSAGRTSGRARGAHRRQEVRLRLPPGKYGQFVLEAIRRARSGAHGRIGRRTTSQSPARRAHREGRGHGEGARRYPEDQTQGFYTPNTFQRFPSARGPRLSQVLNSAGTGPGDGANPTVRGSTLGGNIYLDGVDSTDPVTGRSERIHLRRH
jgi:hypothetical protein